MRNREELHSYVREDVPIVIIGAADWAAAPPLNLAKYVAPEMVVIDCGGAGQCGPNTFAFLLGLADVATLDGPELREAIRTYVQPRAAAWCAPPRSRLPMVHAGRAGGNSGRRSGGACDT